MNQYVILALAIVLTSIAIVSGTKICDNAPCESQINTTVGAEFTISFESNPSTSFEWWTKFDPNFLSLTNSNFNGGNEKSGMVGVPGKDILTFNTENAGNTDVILLLLQPWENGTIAERKIFPINIMSTAVAPKQAISLGKGGNPYENLGGLATRTTRGTSSSSFTSESAMETPSMAASQFEPGRSDLSSLSKSSF